MHGMDFSVMMSDVGAEISLQSQERVRRLAEEAPAPRDFDYSVYHRLEEVGEVNRPHSSWMTDTYFSCQQKS